MKKNVWRKELKKLNKIEEIRKWAEDHGHDPKDNIFKLKTEYDAWWKEALRRCNKINRGEICRPITEKNT